MRYFVWCKVHPGEKIYINFQNQPKTRSEIPSLFSLKCPKGSTSIYSNRDVQAEIGETAIAGALLGALLFVIDPVLGLLGAITGGAIGGLSEKQSVDNFNNSEG